MPFTDSFTGTSGTDIAVYSANWTRVGGSSGDAQINASNQVKCTISVSTSAAYTAPDCGTADHYGQCVWRGGTSSAFNCCVRVVNASNFIGARGATSAWQAFKRVAGTFTSIGSYSATVASGDVMKCEMSGTGFTFYLNGVSRITGTVSDSVFSGVTKAGFVPRSEVIDPWLDDWESTQSAGGGVVGPLVYAGHLMSSILVGGRLTG